MQELRRLADAGGAIAASRLADLLLSAPGDVDQAITVLRPHSNDRHLADTLAWLLTNQGRTDEAIEALRPHTFPGDRHITPKLAKLFAQQGNVDELRRLAEAGNGLTNESVAENNDLSVGDAAKLLVEPLAALGRMDEVHTAILQYGRQPDFARWLHSLLAEETDLAGLRQAADAGDTASAHRLVRRLAEQNDIDGLRQLTYAGRQDAALPLAELLALEGRVDDAIALLSRIDRGDTPSASPTY